VDPAARRRAHPVFRLAVVLVAFATLSGPPAQAEAAPPYRIGVLNEAWAANHPTVEGLKAGLRARGLAEGRDVTFEVHFTEGNNEVLPAEAQALIKAKVDLIFTNNEAAALAARTPRKISLSYSRWSAIRSQLESYRIWRGPLATSRALPAARRRSSRSASRFCAR
jgi:hypothetical protein